MSDHENEPDVDEPEDEEPTDESDPSEGGRPIAEI